MTTIERKSHWDTTKPKELAWLVVAMQSMIVPRSAGSGDVLPSMEHNASEDIQNMKRLVKAVVAEPNPLAVSEYRMRFKYPLDNACRLIRSLASICGNANDGRMPAWMQTHKDAAAMESDPLWKVIKTCMDVIRLSGDNPLPDGSIVLPTTQSLSFAGWLLVQLMMHMKHKHGIKSLVFCAHCQEATTIDKVEWCDCGVPYCSQGCMAADTPVSLWKQGKPELNGTHTGSWLEQTLVEDKKVPNDIPSLVFHHSMGGIPCIKGYKWIELLMARAAYTQSYGEHIFYEKITEPEALSDQMRWIHQPAMS